MEVTESITQSESLIIKTTWSYVIHNSEEAGVLFYSKLFELDPSLKQLFKTDQESQARKLMATITFIVAIIGNIEQLSNEVESLAKRHIAYGVRPEHYKIAGAALLWTLEKGLGDNWTHEAIQAWTKAYNIIVRVIVSTY